MSFVSNEAYNAAMYGPQETDQPGAPIEGQEAGQPPGGAPVKAEEKATPKPVRQYQMFYTGSIFNPVKAFAGLFTKLTLAEQNMKMMENLNRDNSTLSKRVAELEHTVEMPGSTAAETVRANLLLGLHAYKENTFEGAAEHLSRVADVEKTPDAFYIEGKVHEELGKKTGNINEFAKAVSCYEKAKCQKEINEIYNHVASLKTQLSEPHVNAKTLTDRNSYALYLLQAHALAKSDKVEDLAKAHYCFEKAIALNDPEKALTKQLQVAAFTKAKGINLPEFYSALGKLYQQAKNYTLAADYYCLAQNDKEIIQIITLLSQEKQFAHATKAASKIQDAAKKELVTLLVNINHYIQCYSYSEAVKWIATIKDEKVKEYCHFHCRYATRYGGQVPKSFEDRSKTYTNFNNYFSSTKDDYNYQKPLIINISTALAKQQ